MTITATAILNARNLFRTIGFSQIRTASAAKNRTFLDFTSVEVGIRAALIDPKRGIAMSLGKTLKQRQLKEPRKFPFMAVTTVLLLIFVSNFLASKF